MDSIGIDLHKRESQLCLLTEDGELIERRIVTSRERFTAVFGVRPPARILLEASTASEWVARHLEIAASSAVHHALGYRDRALDIVRRFTEAAGDLLTER